MSNDLARARARKAAGEWVNGQWPNGESHFNRDALILAFEAGLEHGADEHTIMVATGQRQLDDATSLMTEAAEHFRGRERAHRTNLVDYERRGENVMAGLSSQKAESNALMAARLEAWLAGEDFYPIKPGTLSADDQAAQEAFVSAALDAGVDQIGEADEPAFTPDRNHPIYDTACKVDPASLEGVDHHTVEDCRQRFENAAPFAGFPGGDFAEAKAMAGGLAIVMPGDPPLNPIDIIREVAEGMVDGDVIKGVDGPSFDRAREYMDAPVEISAIMAPPLRDGDLTMAKEEPVTEAYPGSALVAARQVQCAAAGFAYWGGGDGPPADLDEEGEVLLDWGEQTESGPRFTICGVEELTPMPGLWAESIDLDSFATIIGYGSSGKVSADFATPADAAAVGLKPADLIAAEPDPRAALVHARKWLSSAEDLIMLAADHIRGVTGANPGSDSEEICQRLDAWLAPMATPAAPTAEEN